MATTATPFNSALLDMSIDDIEDLAGFEVPPNGVYVLKFNSALKVVNDKDAIENSFEIIQTLELNDANSVPSKDGTKFSTLYFVGNEIALGRAKEFFKPISEQMGVINLLQLITQDCKDLIITAKVTRKADKNDAEKFYATVSNVTFE